LTNTLQRQNEIAFGYTRSTFKNVGVLNEKVDSLLCPFRNENDTVPIDVVVQGQGCDGIDQNCDHLVDDCSEDKVPPTISLKKHIPEKPFRSIVAAKDWLNENIVVTDDCAAVLDFEITSLNNVVCKQCNFTVRAFDTRCDGRAAISSRVGDGDTNGKPSSTKLFELPVDSEDPEISCGFYFSNDKNHTMDAGNGEKSHDLLHIDPYHYPHEDLINVLFWYHIEVSFVNFECLSAISYGRRYISDRCFVSSSFMSLLFV
jgi:hypothetical protein